MALDYDIVIVGGGLIGSTLALALQSSPWRIAFIEAHLPPQHPQTTADRRTLALSYANQQILQQLGTWGALTHQATPIQKIHISEQGHFGNTVLTAESLHLPALGYVIPILDLYNALQQQLLPHSLNITFYRPAELTHIVREQNYWKLVVNQQSLRAALVIAADGDKSFIRKNLNISTHYTDYQQTAIVSNLQTTKPHHHIAYERFTSQGILALLPLNNNHMGVIWTLANENAEHLLKSSDAEFMALTQKAIGNRVGNIIQLGKRQSYPLKEMHADTQILAGLVLLGNSAHTLHPVAAQGFNLGLRDAITLATLLNQTTHLPNEKLLHDYLSQRQNEQQQTMAFTHRLVNLFTPQTFPLPQLRGLGLAAFDLMPRLKQRFCRKRLGKILSVTKPQLKK